MLTDSWKSIESILIARQVEWVKARCSLSSLGSVARWAKQLQIHFHKMGEAGQRCVPLTNRAAIHHPCCLVRSLWFRTSTVPKYASTTTGMTQCTLALAWFPQGLPGITNSLVCSRLWWLLRALSGWGATRNRFATLFFQSAKWAEDEAPAESRWQRLAKETARWWALSAQVHRDYIKQKQIQRLKWLYYIPADPQIQRKAKWRIVHCSPASSSSSVHSRHLLRPCYYRVLPNDFTAVLL